MNSSNMVMPRSKTLMHEGVEYTLFLLVASWMRLLNTCILELLAHHCHRSSPASKCSVQAVFSRSSCCRLCVLYFHAYMYTCLHTCVHAHVCMHTCVYMYVYAIWLACSCKTSTSRYFVQFSWVQFCVREISTFVHVISLWIIHCFVNSFAFAGGYGHCRNSPILLFKNL